MTGVATLSLTVPVTGGGVAVLSRTIALPYSPVQGTLTVVGRAAGTAGGADTVLVAVFDSAPPQVTALTATTPSDPHPGDTLTVSYAVQDNAGLVLGILALSGAISRTDSIVIDTLRSQAGTIRAVVPAGATAGSSVRATFEARDVAGRSATANVAAVVVADTEPPTVTGSALGTSGNHIIGPGELIATLIRGQDNHRVAWLGAILSGPSSRRDSFAVADSAVGNVVFQASSLPPGVYGVRLFARDSVGNLAQVAVDSQVVVSTVRVPAGTVPLSAPIRDLVYDQRRDRIYATQPDSQRILVIQPNPFAVVGTIPTPGHPLGADLTLGGDTLLVALSGTHRLAVVDLRASPATVDTVHLGILTDPTVWPDNIRVMAGDRAMITTSFGGTGYGGSVVQLALADGAQSFRADIGSVSEQVPLAASQTRSRMGLLIGDECCPAKAYVYDAAGDAFGPSHATVSYFAPGITTDSTGSRFLIGWSLFDQSLTFVRHLSALDLVSGGSALSVDGQFAFMSVLVSYVKFRTSDGVPVEQGRLPDVVSRFLPLPGGLRLVAAGPRQLMLINQQ